MPRRRAQPSTSALIRVGWRKSLPFFEHRHRHPSREAGVKLVEVGDRLLAQLPAEIDVAALVAADEIDQTYLEVLQLAADLGQLVEVDVEAVDGRIQFGLYAVMLFAGGGFEVGLELGGLLAGGHDVADDSTDQGQRLVCFLEGKTPAGSGGKNRLGSKRLRTGHGKCRL